MEAARSPLSSFAARLVATATVVALMLAATFQLWPRVSFWQQQRLATRLIAELEHTASPQIHTTLKQITSLGNPAIEPLVIAAASERADIALAARRIIEEQLATWKIRAGSKEQSSLSEPTSLLAAALAKHIAELGPFGQQWATRITLDLVDIAGRIPTKAAVPILADCSVVLSATPALGPRMLTPEPPTLANDTEPIAVELSAVRLPALPHEQPGRPIDRPLVDIASRDPQPAVPLDSSLATQELLNSTELPRESNWVPEWLAKPDSPVAQPQPVEDSAPAIQTAAPGELIDVPSPDQISELMKSLRPLSMRELLLQMNAADKFTAAAIREVFAERGIAAEELAVAARLLAADPAERIKLIDEVKVLPARTARRWLRELLIDADAEVRLKALTALATTNDPELRSIARDIAVRDTDRRVAEMATQIMRQTR